MVAWKMTPEASWPPTEGAAPGEHRRRRQPAAADASTCVPNGLSVFYTSVYKQDETIAREYGYDASDTRYRSPPNSNYIPGGNATAVYTHPTQTKAKLWIGSTHIAHNDEEFLRCIGAEAFVDLQAPILYSRDKDPYNRKAYHVYPKFEPATMHDGWSIPQINLPGREWGRFYGQIETFIDTHLAAGRSVFMYDANTEREEACAAAGATAVTYVMKKDSLTAEQAIARLAAKHPCITGYYTSPRTLAKIQVLKTRALNICPDEEGHGTDELPCVRSVYLTSHIATRRLDELLGSDERGADQSVPEDIDGLIASREELLAQFADKLFLPGNLHRSGEL